MDDGIILMNNKNDLNMVYGALKDKIKEYRLEFNSKARIYKSNEGFEFIGISYIIKDNKLIKRISKRSKKKTLKKVNKKNYKFYKHYMMYVK